MKEQARFNLIFVKLGGSLITDKRQAETPRRDVIARLAQEIAAARAANPALRLVVGHGSGSFGHVVGSRYGTRQGARTSEEWFGFAATADAAARLNRILVAALLAANVPAWTIQPSVVLRCADGRITGGQLDAVALALDRGLTPVIHGDVALDSERGGTIVSTEEIFEWLATMLLPDRIVLAGEVDGVYTSDPLCDPSAQRITAITPSSVAYLQGGLGHSFGTDVTGGMAAKVRQAIDMVERHRNLHVVIGSGLAPGALYESLLSAEAPGTLVHADP